jgi:hypothetical protein
MRPLLLLLLPLWAVPAAAQSAAQVCGKIMYADQRVACLRTITGHEVEPEAAQVCGTILYADQLVQCMAAVLDKHYEADALAACRSIMFADQKTQCMAASGVARRAPRGRDDDRWDDDDRPRARREARPRYDSTVTFENRTSRTTAVRTFWRWAGRGEWTEFGRRQRIGPGQELSLQSTSGLFDFCVDTSDGRSATWFRIRLDADERRLFFERGGLDEHACLDP